jgi:tRNA pseudouridine32 synthase/23S rRNA pseudouridine746 synthase
MTIKNEFELIYRDEALLAANKPAGLLAVPGRGADKQDCLFVRIQKIYPDALIVHRLDMATSGLIIFARGLEMQRKLSRLFHDRNVQKYYEAVVDGRLDEAGEITLPLIADWPNRPKQKVDLGAGKHSLTRYRLLQYDSTSDTSRVELEPVTGRTHQLRLHLAAVGHPVIGDVLYDGRPAERLMLHATKLSMAHPISGQLLNLHCEAPLQTH